MDQGGLNLEPEVVQILQHVKKGENFLLSGGAGSGKTYSLVQIIGELLRTEPSVYIACITYTNAAVREIESRVSSNRLSVATIHDFLWSVISPYQTELRTVLSELLSGAAPQIKPGNIVVSPEMFDGVAISYKDYRMLEKGIISHDEIIVVARVVFEIYPKIRDILRDRFRYILVDEYQDTDPEVIKILLNYLPHSTRKGICGFFGDAMQSIYDGSIGSIQDYVDRQIVSEVRKEQNRRNPRLVYELANELRFDGLRQHASNDPTAPNMIDSVVKDGVVTFFYSIGERDELQAVRQSLGWNFRDVTQTKELNLTHNLIAPQAGFRDLMEIYDKDHVLGFRDRIVAFIRKNDDFAKYDHLSFGEVVDGMQTGKAGRDLKAVSPTDSMQEFINAHPDLLEAARNTEFQKFRRMHVDKDQLIDDKKQTEEDVERKGSQRCDFIKHVFKIQTVVDLYEKRRYNDFLRKTEYRVGRAKDKARLKECIETLSAMSDRPVIEVIDFAHDNGLCIKDDRFHDFRQRKGYLFDRLIGVNYASYRKLYEYLEGRTAYSTQHKIKGQEFDRVLVVLDSGGWNNYNFNYLFEGGGTDTVRQRTQKLFYVCCTRTRECLAIYFRNPTPAALVQAVAWFGNQNVIKV
jgi:DNA helicase-2/ATP-dependent DNA helicase PcrA